MTNLPFSPVTPESCRRSKDHHHLPPFHLTQWVPVRLPHTLFIALIRTHSQRCQRITRRHHTQAHPLRAVGLQIPVEKDITMPSNLSHLKNDAYHNHINLILSITLLPSRSSFRQHPTTNGRTHRTTMGLNSTTHRPLSTATILKANFLRPHFSHRRVWSWPVLAWPQGIRDWMTRGARLCKILGFWMVETLQTMLVTTRDVKLYGTILKMYNLNRVILCTYSVL